MSSPDEIQAALRAAKDAPISRNGSNGVPAPLETGGRASTIDPEPVDWLWWPFLPRRKITAVAGQMGQAKSLLVSYLHAAVSRGEGLNQPRAGNGLLANVEDDPADTTRPRLEAADADLERIWLEESPTLTPDRIRAIHAEMGGLDLVTLDPVQAYMPAGVNSWKGQEVRLFLEPYRQLSAELGFAIVLVQHLNRRADASDPLARIADSQGITQLARSVLIWGPDPADPEGDQGTRKVLTRAKANLARATAAATFTIVETTVSRGIKAPVLVRGEDRSVTADDVVSDAETRTAADEAAEWLRATLAGGPLDAKDVVKRAREDGISERTLKRAKHGAGVVSEQSRSESGIAAWQWRLRAQEDPRKNLGIVGTLGTVGPLPPEGKGAKGAKGANSYKGAGGSGATP